VIGSRIHAYEIVAELGSGGMGTVYLAQVREPVLGLATGQQVALKLIHPSLEAQPGFFQRFLQEARAGQRVRQANVVRTYDCDVERREDGTWHYLVMEYVDGQNLRDLLQEMGTVPEELCRHVGCEVARGLSAIHAAGVVHRDIKPENVIITADHEVKIMDLGVARLQDEVVRLSQAGMFVGSLEYAAPEQFGGSNLDADGRADQHALGVLLYELASGRHPFRAESLSSLIRHILEDTPPRLGEACPHVSPFLEEVVRTLLAKRPEDRFGSTPQLLEVLEQAEDGAWWRDRARVLQAGRHVPLRRIRLPRETSLHGRDEPMARLRGAYERARQGEGQAVLLVGEAGIGKSRLVEEFIDRLADSGEDLNVLVGTYPPGKASTADGALSTAFREHLGRASAAPYLRETPLLADAFDAVLNGVDAPPGAQPLSAAALRTCFVNLSRALAAERPTLLVLEDFHFAPVEARAIFSALAAGTRGDRIVLVATMRPGGDEEAWWTEISRLPHATQEVLRRLPREHVEPLLREAFHTSHLPPDLGPRIIEKSDGNPFFIFEILRGLRDSHAIERRGDGNWVTTRRVADIQIPSSVLDLVRARVAALTAGEREVLDVASCFGFAFDPLFVGEVLGLPRIEILRILTRIEREHRLIAANGRQYVFDHHQVQEALYCSLSDLLKEEYHGAVAAALEARGESAFGAGAAGAGTRAVEITRHWLAAGHPERARPYMHHALTHLEAGYLHATAVALLDRILGAPGLVTGLERLELLLRQARQLDQGGDREAQAAALEEASRLATKTGDDDAAMRVSAARGHLAWRRSHLEEARRHFGDALARARRTGNRRGEVGALGNLALVFQAEERLPEAREHMARTERLAHAIGNRAFEAAAAGNLGNILLAEGRLREARASHAKNLELARADGNLPSEAAAHGNLGVLDTLEGDFSSALGHQQRYLALARQTGDRNAEALACTNLGTVERARGLLRGAHERTAQACTLAGEIGDPSLVALTLANMADVLLAEGRLLEARQHAERAGHMSRDARSTRREAQACTSLARVLHAQERLEEARASAERARALARGVGARPIELQALRILAEILRSSGRVEDVRARLEEAASLADEMAVTGAQVLVAAGQALLPGGDRERAAALLRTGADRLAVEEALEANYLVWCATADGTWLERCAELLDAWLAGAPERARETMLSEVPLLRHVDLARTRYLQDEA
jgi:tetratricopeptide (TPR) repeat protein